MLSPRKLNGYMKIAFAAADLSKDQSTRVGALILGPDEEVLSIGYNGFCRGMDDSKPERHERPEKYFWTEHAERNAIYNAAKTGTPLRGATLFATKPPCCDCLRGIIQSGIIRIVTISEQETMAIWNEHMQRSSEMYKEVGLELILLKPDEDGDFLRIK